MAHRGKGTTAATEEDITSKDPDEQFEICFKNVATHAEAPDTDWDSVYVRLKLSPLGTDLTPASFLATPVRVISWLLTKLNEYEQNQQNIQAHSTAILNSQVVWAMYGMGGGKGPKPATTYRDFLPFPDAVNAQEKAHKVARIAQTRKTLTALLHSGELPYHIVVALWHGPGKNQP